MSINVLEISKTVEDDSPKELDNKKLTKKNQ